MSGHSNGQPLNVKARRRQAWSAFTAGARDRHGGARRRHDPDSNFKLRLAVDKARGNNMPKDNIERAINRGTGDGEGGALEQILYEGYGNHGVALMIECVTDNRNRAVSDLRRTLTRTGGNLAEGGAVAWQFNRIAYFSFPLGDKNSDSIFEIAVDAGADDVQFNDGLCEIFAPVEAFKTITDALRANNVTPEEAELRMQPTNMAELSAADTVKVMKLIEELEELDDVQKVYSNLHISDEALEAMA